MMERNKADNKDFVVEHYSVPGVIYVTIDKKLICLETFKEHIKVEVTFGVFDLAEVDKNPDICNLKQETETDADLQVSVQNNDLYFKAESNQIVTHEEQRSFELVAKSKECDSSCDKGYKNTRSAAKKRKLIENDTLDSDNIKIGKVKSHRRSRKSLYVTAQSSRKITRKKFRQFDKQKTIRRDLIKLKESHEKILPLKSKKEKQTRSKSEDLSCPHCNKDFKTKREFWDHYRIERKGYPCKDCGKISKFWAHYIVHQKISHNQDISPSPRNDYDEIESYVVLSIETSSKGDIYYKCNLCHATTEHLESIRKHMLKHSNENVFQCCICGVETRYFDRLSNHFKEHSISNVNKFVSPDLNQSSEMDSVAQTNVYYDKQYFENNDGENFENQFANDKEFKINGRGNDNNSICSSNFIRPFSCLYCKKSFKSKQSYTNHRRVATEGFTCDDCGRMFKYKAQCIVHKKLIHGFDTPLLSQDSSGSICKTCSCKTDANGVKSYRCDICDIDMNCLHNLNRHMMKHTNEHWYECCVCKLQFSYFGMFSTHLRTHSINANGRSTKRRQPKTKKNLSCPHCSESFESELDYKAHHEVKSLMQYRCETCNEIFTRKAHLIVHANIVHKVEAPASLLADLIGSNETDNISRQLTCFCFETNDIMKSESYKCNVCNGIFDDLRVLNKHMMKHTSEYAYKCCVCAIEEWDDIDFAIHLATHIEHSNLNEDKTILQLQELDKTEDGKKFCQYCKTNFKNQLEFNKHFEVESLSLTCEKCPKICKFRGHLITHYNIVHKMDAPFSSREMCVDNQSSGILCTKETNEAGEVEYKCNICDMSLVEMRNLSKHMLQHTGENVYRCCVCDFKNCQKGSLKRHQIKHIRPNHFQCKLCEQYFRDRTELAQHKASHKLHCELCGQEFDNITSRNSHVKVDHKNDERIFTCDQCGRLYTTKKALEAHKDYHRFTKTVQCPECGIFVQRLKHHMLVHSSTPNDVFPCPRCHLQLKTRSALERHLRTHTHTYSCPHCHKKFNHNGGLSRHLKIHIGEKPYVCEICGKACNRPGNLRTHMRVHDKKPKIMYCSHCGLGFPNKKNLQEHVDTEHKIMDKNDLPVHNILMKPSEHYFEGAGGSGVGYQMYF